MNRRQLIRLGGTSLIAAGLAPLLRGAVRSHAPGGLFFDSPDLPRIRANARTPLLAPLFREWAETPASSITDAIATFRESGDFIRDFPAIFGEMTHHALVELVRPEAPRRRALLDGLRFLVDQPHWDYFRDRDDQVLGIQRASAATQRVLWVREALAAHEPVDPALDLDILRAVADLGCAACFRTVDDMNRWQEGDHGWDFDDAHAWYFDISMERWPMILGSNNLRAAPTAALGMGAIALLGHDDRAQGWLDSAIASSRRVLHLFSPDGSYFEGVSYAGYTLRTLFSFFEAYQRNGGEVDWSRDANLDGIVDFIATMQLGYKDDGNPDIVNYSDAFNAVGLCIPGWIGRQTGNPNARWVSENCCRPWIHYDFLWYDPEPPLVKPAPTLMNVRNDLDWVLCRTGWGANDAFLAFKSGGPANHEHADRNSFIYKYQGERLLNDHFGAAYDWRQPRWPVRLTRGHNAVLIGGKGQNYHKGEEGTNESRSYATIVAYEDRGGVVWWTSDATPAYQLDNNPVFKVLRTVLFAKPDTVVVLDQVRLRYELQPVDIRFYPDNADGGGTVYLADDFTFGIRRPGAFLSIRAAATGEISARSGKLDVPAEHGNFPFLEFHGEAALRHDVITLMTASPAGRPVASNLIESAPGGWRVRSRRLDALVLIEDVLPQVKILQS